MFAAKTLVALASFLCLSAATPSNPSRRDATVESMAETTTCGKAIEPSIIQYINQSAPNVIYPNNYRRGGEVFAYQGTQYLPPSGIIQTNRVKTILAFTDIPAQAYGCQLNFYLPPGYPIHTAPYGTLVPQTNIRTFGVGQLGKNPTGTDWNWINVSQYDNPPATVFGTLRLETGVTRVVNSAMCPYQVSGGASNTMAFTFEIADWVQVEAGVAFDRSSAGANGTGPFGFYLTYNC